MKNETINVEGVEIFFYVKAHDWNKSDPNLYLDISSHGFPVTNENSMRIFEKIKTALRSIQTDDDREQENIPSLKRL